jgi:cellobiose-specific phosphotransferase system component IIA
MKKLLIIFAMTSVLAACDNKSGNNGSGEYNSSDAASGNRNSVSGNNYPDSLTRVEGAGDNWNHSVTYVLTGTAFERKNSFDQIASDLEKKINMLKGQDVDDDVKEKLEEANEKIGEAREKLVKADEKSLKGNTEDAIEKVDDAREKLDEAREKYMEAVEKLVDN